MSGNIRARLAVVVCAAFLVGPLGYGAANNLLAAGGSVELLIKTEADTNAKYASGQPLIQITSAMIPAVYHVKVCNKSAAEASFTIKAETGTAKGWTAGFNAGPTYITAEMIGKGYTTPKIPAGGAQVITVFVEPDNSVATFDVTLLAAQGNQSASARLTTKATGWKAFYISPDGKATNDGSMAQPWPLDVVLKGLPAITPGSTLFLRGGTYTITGYQTWGLSGTKEAPVKVRQYPGEMAILDTGNSSNNSITVMAPYLWLWGFTIAGSGTDRGAQSANGMSIRFAASDKIMPGQKGINLIVHDCADSVNFWQGAIDGELNGNIIYFLGFDDPQTRGHGHAIYTQNGEGRKLIKNNVAFAQFSFGLHGYTQKGVISNFDVIGNISFEQGTASQVSGRTADIIWANKKFTGNTFKKNLCYMSEGGTAAQIGEWQPGGDAVIADNYFVAPTGVALSAWVENLTLTGNTFVGPAYINQGTQDGKPVRSPNSKFPDNKFEDKKPTGLVTFVYPNDYEPSRGFLTVFNWDNKPSADVDVSAIPGLQAGDVYEVLDVQDVFGPAVAKGIYSGDKITVPLANLPVAKVNGRPNQYKHTPAEFNCFLVRTVFARRAMVRTVSAYPVTAPADWNALPPESRPSK
jgi:hypothetical protein